MEKEELLMDCVDKTHSRVFQSPDPTHTHDISYFLIINLIITAFILCQALL